MTVLRDSVSDSVSVNGTSDPSEPKGSKRGMKMFTRFGSLTLGSGTLFLTLGSLTLSSCSLKNNPVNDRGIGFDGTSVAENKAKEGELRRQKEAREKAVENNEKKKIMVT